MAIDIVTGIPRLIQNGNIPFIYTNLGWHILAYTKLMTCYIYINLYIYPLFFKVALDKVLVYK